MLKNRVAALVLVMLFAVSCYGVWAASQEPPSPQPHTNERAERPGENENRANNNSGITSSAYLQEYSAYCATEPEKKDEKWRHEFWCEFKVTDAVIAAFTVVLAIVTAGLIIVGICQSRQIEKTIALARNEFISTQRPKLRIRNIIISHLPDNNRGTPRLFTGGMNLRCQFFVSNIGGTDAHITDAYATVFQSTIGLPMRRPYEGQNGNLPVPKGSLAPGRSKTLIFVSEEVVREPAQTIGNARIVSGIRLFVLGWIEYKDNIDVARRTAFCREFKQGSFDEGRFRRVKNRDYEYEE